jgi:type III secretion protein T
MNELPGAYSALFSNLHALLFLIALCSIRTLVIFFILPATTDPMIPGAPRAAIACVLAAFVAVGQRPEIFDSMGSATLTMIAGKEAFIGLVIGYMASTFFWIAQSVGALIDDLAGFNNVQMTNPQQGEQSTPVSSLLLQLVVTLFYVSGGLAILLGVLFKSYLWWPITAVTPDLQSVSADLAIGNGDAILGSAAKLGAPVMLTLVLIDVGFGVVSRAASKLEPGSLSQPVKGMVAVIVLVAITASVVTQVRSQLHLGGLEATLARFASPASSR